MFPTLIGQKRPSDGHRPTDRRRTVERLDALEDSLTVLENTLKGLAREVDVSVGCICADCEGAYTLIADGGMYCPACQSRTGM